MTKISRTDGTAPCTVCFEDSEWKALYAYSKKTKILPKTPPTLEEAVKMIAEIGGFLGRKSDGDPGPITIWRGLITLATIVMCYKMFNPP